MPKKKKLENQETFISDCDILQNNLQNTDVGAKVMMDCGMESGNIRHITKLLSDREHGIMSFRNSHKRNIASRFLPNQLICKIPFQRKLFCGLFSKDGDYFISGCQDGKIRIYKPGPRKLIKCRDINVLNMCWSVLDIALSSDASKMIYTSWSDKLHLCDLIYRDKPQQQLDMQLDTNVGESVCLFSVVFSHDDKEVLGGTHGGDIIVYNLETMERTMLSHGHLDDINTVNFADDSSFIFVTGGDDGLCKVWDRRTLNERKPDPVGVFAGHYDGVTFVDAKKDGRCFLSNSKDQTIKLWDIRKFSSPQGIMGTQKEVNKRNWDYRWQSIPKQNPLKINGDTSLMTYRGHEVRCTLIRARFSPLSTTGQRFIYCGSSTGEIHMYDLLTGRVVSILQGHYDCTRDVHWHPFSPILASSSWDCTVGYWTYSEEDLGPPEFRTRTPDFMDWSQL